jgi:hypothetical protein
MMEEDTQCISLASPYTHTHTHTHTTHTHAQCNTHVHIQHTHAHMQHICIHPTHICKHITYMHTYTYAHILHTHAHIQYTCTHTAHTCTHTPHTPQDLSFQWALLDSRYSAMSVAKFVRQTLIIDSKRTLEMLRRRQQGSHVGHNLTKTIHSQVN